jgi:hypothetical protein
MTVYTHNSKRFFPHERKITMGMLRVLSHRGDDRYPWDHQAVIAGDTEAQAAVREAERIFNEERQRGSTAFRKAPGQDARRIDVFDPATEEDIILVPAVRGG